MKHVKLLIAGLMAGVVAFSAATPIFAYTNSSADAEYEDTDADGTQQTTVYAEIGSSYTITIPKNITLAGAQKAGSYTVEVTGDIGGMEVISVVPDSSATLSSKNILDTTAVITQDKTDWYCSEITPADSVSANGSIAASGMTAGVWRGTFNFNITLGAHTHSYVETITKEATCTDAGEKTIACACGDSTTEIIPALGHNYENSVCTTCSAIQYTDFTLTATNYTQTGITSLAGDVVIPETFEYNGTYYRTTAIEQFAFKQCVDMTSVTVPDSVTDIGQGAFYKCTNLTKAVLPKDLTVLNDGTFANCLSLTDVNIPDGVTSIGTATFSACKSLANVELPTGLNTIKASAFTNCKSLVAIDIPNTVTSIEGKSFWYAGLTELYIPASVTSIGVNPFAGCIPLAKITVDSDNPVYDSSEDCNAIIETATNTIVTGCKNTVILDNITSIGGYAFLECTALTSLEIPSGVTSIGEGTFGYCTNMETIILPTSITSIGDYAFNGCNTLTINYRGTSAQWSKITKGTDWSAGDNYTVGVTYNYTD